MGNSVIWAGHQHTKLFIDTLTVSNRFVTSLRIRRHAIINLKGAVYMSPGINVTFNSLFSLRVLEYYNAARRATPTDQQRDQGGDDEAFHGR